MLCRELGELKAAADAVITCGGVGPTVDDCTIEAVAMAAGTRVATHHALEASLRDYFGDAVCPPLTSLRILRKFVRPAVRPTPTPNLLCPTFQGRSDTALPEMSFCHGHARPSFTQFPPGPGSGASQLSLVHALTAPLLVIQHHPISGAEATQAVGSIVVCWTPDRPYADRHRIGCG